MPLFTKSSDGNIFTLPFRRRRKMYTVNEPDPSYNVIYLGNVVTSMAKGDTCADKPLALIWKTYESRTRPDMPMELSVTRQGLKAETKQQGLTEYWAHRTTYCIAPPKYPRVFCWIYKHDGKRMKPELRCHAVLCRKTGDPSQIALKLVDCLSAALLEYKREKVAKQKTRLTGTITGYSSLPRRKDILTTGSKQFRPPVSRSKSAPRLVSIDEEQESSDDSKDRTLSPGHSVRHMLDDSLCLAEDQDQDHTLPIDHDVHSLSAALDLVVSDPTIHHNRHTDYPQSSPSTSNSSEENIQNEYQLDLEIGNDLDKLRLLQQMGSAAGHSSDGSAAAGEMHNRIASAPPSEPDSMSSDESGYHEKSSLEDDDERSEDPTLSDGCSPAPQRAVKSILKHRQSESIEQDVADKSAHRLKIDDEIDSNRLSTNNTIKRTVQSQFRHLILVQDADDCEVVAL